MNLGILNDALLKSYLVKFSWRVLIWGRGKIDIFAEKLLATNLSEARHACIYRLQTNKRQFSNARTKKL